MGKVSNKKALVIDKGLSLHLATQLGRKFDKVYYYLQSPNAYPNSPIGKIGTGLEEVERVYHFYPYINQVDYIYFFDCYDGPWQQGLIEEGRNVFGSGMSEKLELDKTYFLETLAKVGLPVPYTYRAEGIEDLCNYLDGKGEKWLKRSYYRGDFETHCYPGNMLRFRPWLDDLKYRIGNRSDEIEILVQDPIKSICEAGVDTFNINGEYPETALVGYEIKDKGYVCKVFEELPPVLQNVSDKMAPIFKKLGCRGHWSNECRITKGGKAFFIDSTHRAPSPPSELQGSFIENYAEGTVEIAEGKVPKWKYEAQYGAQIVLTSDWHVKHELFVDIPKDLEPYVKLKNYSKRNGHLYCIPNGNEAYFGSVIAWGDSVKSATRKCIDIMKEINADEMDCDVQVFDKANEAIESGREVRIDF